MDLIPLSTKTASALPKNIVCPRRFKEAAKKAKTRAVRDLVFTMCDESLTLEQQVHVICAAVKHQYMKLRSASAGMHQVSRLLMNRLSETFVTTLVAHLAILILDFNSQII